MSLRIVIGCDDAGLQYKEILRRDLEDDARVQSIVDVGVRPDEHTAYPHVAVTAARLVADGAADRALLVCGSGLWRGDQRKQGSRDTRRRRPRQLLGRTCSPEQ